ncbi:MFS transporter [Alphaproteobacteria bacterium]|nr:MFS transporter [Alphaproteobacteria bacterium]
MMLRPFRDPRVLSVGILGVVSGLPFMLTLSTLTFWLFESGVSKTEIGLFFVVTLPYSLKFLWAPFVDGCRLPWIGDLLGHRRSWLVLIQILLMIALILLGQTNPKAHLGMTALLAFMVAFLSATQDMIYEAYRVEVLKGPLLGYGIGASVQGYRLGMWISGAGALYLAALFSWSVAYAFMACGMLMGVVATLLSPDPEDTQAMARFTRENWSKALKSFLGRGDWSFILVFILAYKVGDTVLNVMTPCFLRELGFTKLQIAHVAKTFGIGAMIFGGLVGGILIARHSLQRMLVLSCSLQALASLFFVMQATMGNNLGFLFVSMGVENFACGISQAALIAYFTSCCRRPHTAMHYALVSSFGALVRVMLSGIAGFGADHLSWHTFYSVTGILCLSGLFFVLWRPYHFARPVSLADVDEASSSPEALRA